METITLKNHISFNIGINEGIFHKITKTNNIFTDKEQAEIIAGKIGIYKTRQVKAFIGGFLLALDNYDFFIEEWRQQHDLLRIASHNKMVLLKGCFYNYNYSGVWYLDEQETTTK